MTELERKLIAYYQQQRRPGDTSPAGTRWNYSIDRGLVLFDRGIDYYRGALEAAGLAGGQRFLDIGFGSAHWLLAALDTSETVSGVEVSKEYLQLAIGLIERLGLRERMSVTDSPAEALPFPSGSFDRVFCHSVLHFIDAEPAMAEAARILVADGLFYCAMTGPGARISAALLEIEARKLAQANKVLRILLSGAIRISGLASPPWSTTRVLGLDEYLGMAAFSGLELVRQPNVQDSIRGVPNFPGTFDVLLTKPQRSLSRRDGLLQAFHASGAAPAEFLDKLLRQSLSHLVHQAVCEGWLQLAPSEQAILLGRSELARSQNPSTALLATALAAMRPGPARAIFAGLQALGQGKAAAARHHFSAAGTEGDAPYLLATLELRADLSSAERRFRQLIEASPDRLWGWAGLLLATLMKEQGAMIDKVTEWVSASLKEGIATRL